MEMESDTDTPAVAGKIVEESPATKAPPVILAAIIIALSILLASWIGSRTHVVQFDKPYQAVLLSNGQVYYGRLDGFGTDHPVLREVYYIQSSVNPQTHEQTNILTRRGKEWHGPDVPQPQPDSACGAGRHGFEGSRSDQGPEGSELIPPAQWSGRRDH